MPVGVGECSGLVRGTVSFDLSLRCLEQRATLKGPLKLKSNYRAVQAPQRLCTRPGPWVRGSAGAAASGNSELTRVPVASMQKAVPGVPGSLLPRLGPELENRNRAAGSDGLEAEGTPGPPGPSFLPTLGSPMWAGGEMSCFHPRTGAVCLWLQTSSLRR